MHPHDKPPSFSVATDLPQYSPDQRPAPAQSRSRVQVEHVYSLNNSKDKPWVILKVNSWSPSAKSLPMFLDGDIITGSVEISLDKPESAKGVTIGVSIDGGPC